MEVGIITTAAIITSGSGGRSAWELPAQLSAVLSPIHGVITATSGSGATTPTIRSVGAMARSSPMVAARASCVPICEVSKIGRGLADAL